MHIAISMCGMAGIGQAYCIVKNNQIINAGKAHVWLVSNSIHQIMPNTQRLEKVPYAIHFVFRYAQVAVMLRVRECSKHSVYANDIMPCCKRATGSALVLWCVVLHYIGLHTV